ATPSVFASTSYSHPTLLIYLVAPVAVWALGLPAQHWEAPGDLEVELADVCADTVETIDGRGARRFNALFRGTAPPLAHPLRHMAASLLYTPAVIYAYVTVKAVAVPVDCAAIG